VQRVPVLECGTCQIKGNTVKSLYSGHHWDPAGCPVERGVPNSEVRRFVHKSLWLGLQTVSSLERCSLFKMSLIKRFNCTVRIII